MIVLKELNPKNYPTTPEIDANLAILLDKMNQVRKVWGKPMLVTSGLRTSGDQARINPKAPKSNHLLGAAVDIGDSKGDLGKWVMDNLKLMEQIGLWIENPEFTKGWVHFQIVPPKSGKRVFNP